MPYNETDPFTTKDVIDQIRAKELDGARDKTHELLYKKSADAIAKKKAETAKSIGKPDVFADVIDAPVEIEPVNIDQPTETGEPATTSEE